ncbi:hypothetical protein AX17_006786, partial [Amanita inopinata Kibby_2008]
MAVLSIQEPEPEPEPEPAPAAHGDQGIVAVVIYDYEAAEDNEINLVEGEHIEQIEEVSDRWWSGVSPGGKTGLFPCEFIL